MELDIVAIAVLAEAAVTMSESGSGAERGRGVEIWLGHSSCSDIVFLHERLMKDKVK